MSSRPSPLNLQNEVDRIATLLNAIGIPAGLAKDLVLEFLSIRDDLRTGTLGKAGPGKFVETIVQILQSLDPMRAGKYDTQVKSVEGDLKDTYESRQVNCLADETRVAMARIARAVYCLRSKRGILHKGDIDPNLVDLEFIYNAAQWILTELIRSASHLSADEARALIDDIQRPVHPSVEHIMGRALVLDGSLHTREEVILVLYDSHPNPVTRDVLSRALDRRHSDTIRKALNDLWEHRIIEGNDVSGYILTGNGIEEAMELMRA